MDIDNQLQMEIEKYLAGKMTQDERNSFELKMKKDPELYKSVKLQEMIVKEIVDRNKFMEIINKPKESSNSKAKQRISNYKWILGLSIAASIIIGVIAVWQPSRMSNEEVFNGYAFVDSKMIKFNHKDIIKGIDDRTLYRNMDGIYSIEEVEIVNKALELYESEKYDSAKTVFNKVQDLKEKDLGLFLFLAISELLSNNTTKAIQHFEFLNKESNFKYHEEVSYYLALGYIKSNQIRKARKTLYQIHKDGGKYSKIAKEILTQARWF